MFISTYALVANCGHITKEHIS